MPRIRLTVLLLAVALVTTAASVARDDRRQQPQPAGTGGPLRVVPDRFFVVDDIKLNLKVDLEKRTVDSQADLAFHTMRPTTSVTLDAVGFKVSKVTLGGQDAQYKHDGQKLVVELGDRWPAGRKGQIHVDYFVEKPRSGLHFFAPTAGNPEIPTQLWSQGETIYNRYWIPCIDDPDVKQTTRMIVTVRKGFEAVSNGKLLSRTENNDGTVTFDWHQDIPHAAYLITLVVGEFDVVSEEWDGIPIVYYVPKGRKAEAMPTYSRTPKMVKYFSELFGIRYPWAKYAQVTVYQFNGAMENTSATSMYEGAMRDERSLLDSSQDDFISHELVHQWWGDMVTCRDWSSTWLNEGFATYGEALWDEHAHGREEYDYTMYQKAAPAIAGGRTRPVYDRRYINPDAMFDGRSYPKGGWALHMLRRKLGDEAFFRCIKEYGTAFKFQCAETNDFRRSCERTTGRSLDRFFYDWLERSGTPTITVATDYLTSDKTAKIVVKQTQTAEAFHIPVKLALHCEGSKEPIIVEQDMTSKELTIERELPGLLERIDVDPDMAVLGDIKETKAAPLWEAQLKGGTLPLRLRAVRHYAEGTPAEFREMLVKAFAAEKHHAVKTALANLLGSAGETISRDALIEALGDKDARVRRSCVLNLGKFKGDPAVAKAVGAIVTKGEPSYAVENAAMEVYAGSGQKDAVDLIKPYLDKPSFQNTTANAAINALAITRDPAAIEPLLPWIGAGHPRASRTLARRALTTLAGRAKPTDEQRRKAVAACVAILEKEPTERTNILNLLPNFGDQAAAALPTVEKLAKEEGGWQSTAEETAKKLRDLAKPTEANKGEKKENPKK